MTKELRRIKEERDRTIRSIFERKSDKMLLVIGPCSAHNEDAVCEYIRRLARLQEEVAEKLVLVPRIYTNKPRTTGEGYKGMAHQPDPEKDPDIREGIVAIRSMHIRAFRESHLSAADEMLYPGNLPYLEDVLSYVAVGARSVENQQHRLTVSGLDVPAGMKNPTGGDIGVMLNAVFAAQLPHEFAYNRWVARTKGNPLAHAVLRGWVDPAGRSFPNYHYEDLIHIAERYLERKMQNPTIIVDTNHNNSNKRFAQQPRIGLEVMRSRSHSDVLRELIRGFMVESYLVEGAQGVDGGVFGKSITDPCLGWEATEVFVKQLAEQA
jgi:3-deoxy-7-phosphoheptulonate synthase